MADINRYLGTFQLDDFTIPGEIVHNEETGTIRLNLTKSFSCLDDLIAETCPIQQDTSDVDADILAECKGKLRLYHRLGYISGKLNNGNPVTLLNCRCTKSTTNINSLSRKLVFAAEVIIWRDPDCVTLVSPEDGSEASPKPVARLYHKFTCILDNALEWAGISRVYTRNRTSLELVPVSNKLKFKWFGAEIKFTTELVSDIWDAAKKETYELHERLKFEITAQNPMTAMDFLQIRNKIIAMISFAVKGNVNIHHQYLNHADDFTAYDFTNEKDYFDFEVTTNEPHRRIWRTEPEDFNFSLVQFKGRDMGKVLTRLEPVFNLYGSLYKYSDMPIEMIFLNTVQAIEKFHSEFHKYGGSKRKYLESIQKRFSQNANYEELKRLFMSDGQMNEHTDYIVLLSRLSDLLVDSGTNSDLFYAFYGEDPDFPHRITNTRHYYTHYGAAKAATALRGDALYDAVKVLKWLLEYHVCKEMGIDIRAKVEKNLLDFFEQKALSKYFIATSSIESSNK